MGDDRIVVTSPWRRQAEVVDESVVSRGDLALMAVGGAPTGLTVARNQQAVYRRLGEDDDAVRAEYYARMAALFRARGAAAYNDIAALRQEAWERHGVVISPQGIRRVLHGLHQPGAVRAWEALPRAVRAANPELAPRS